MSKVRVPIADLVNRSNQGEKAIGLRCPKCGAVQARGRGMVRNTRQGDGAIKRYRTCWNCDATMTTYERLLRDDVKER